MGRAAVRIVGAEKRYNSSAAENAEVVIAAPAKLFTATIHNGSASDQWFQIFDATAVPADATVPVLTQKVLAGNTAAFDYTDGIIFTLGIVVTNSSTAQTKTLGSADCLFCVTYRAFSV